MNIKYIWLSMVPFIALHGTYNECDIINTYKAPESIVKVLDEVFKNKLFLDAFNRKDKKKLAELGCTVYRTDWGNIVFSHPDLPDYIIKGEKPYQNKNWRRVLYGEEMRKAALEYPDIVVPTEYLYNYPNKPNNLNSQNYCIISEKVALKPYKLSTYLVEQRPDLIMPLKKIMKKVQYWDPGIESNIGITDDEKIVFLDTEPYSDDSNFVLQFILDRIFFKGLPPGDVAINRLTTLIENVKNPKPQKSRHFTKTKISLCVLGIAAIYFASKAVK